jgi:hypothetical protein
MQTDTRLSNTASFQYAPMRMDEIKRLAVNAKVATVLDSIPAFSDTVDGI